MPPSQVTETEVLDALRPVQDPELGRSIVDLDMVRDVRVDDGRVGVTVALTVAGCPLRAEITDRVTRAVQPLEGVQAVDVELTVMTDEQRAALRDRMQGERPQGAAAAQGHGVAVLDADVYGFSVPRMLGIDQEPVVIDGMIVPPVGHGVKVVSTGFFVGDDQPVIWRGPMLHKALEQFLTDVLWGEPDYLLIDMPPGTGDVALSMAQFVKRAEVLVVTTPQPAAQRVAQRSAH